MVTSAIVRTWPAGDSFVIDSVGTSCHVNY